MLANTSSTSTDQLDYYCSHHKVYLYISIGVLVAKTLLVLPLSIFVLYLGHQRWRQQRSFKTTSHSDIFTFHLAVVELFWALGATCYIYSAHKDHVWIKVAGLFGFSVGFFGEVFFHLLTCVERYLAVVHPVTYLMLKTTRGVQIRNFSVGCVWLLCFGLVIFNVGVVSESIIKMLCVLVLSIVVMTFCSVSVLWVLIRPGPGEGGREKVDQTKLRAFHTITAISGVLWVWFIGLFVCFALSVSSVLSASDNCLIGTCVTLLGLPSSLVSPLLYLHRAGKLSWNCWN